MNRASCEPASPRALPPAGRAARRPVHLQQATGSSRPANLDRHRRPIPTSRILARATCIRHRLSRYDRPTDPTPRPGAGLDRRAVRAAVGSRSLETIPAILSRSGLATGHRRFPRRLPAGPLRRLGLAPPTSRCDRRSGGRDRLRLDPGRDRHGIEYLWGQGTNQSLPVLRRQPRCGRRHRGARPHTRCLLYRPARGGCGALVP